MKINLISLFTDQFAEMKAFYRDVLEFEITNEVDSDELGNDEPKNYVEFGGQPVRFAICNRQVMKEVTGYAGFDQPSTGTPFEMAFQCETREALEKQFEQLLGRGAKCVKRAAEMPWGQYTAFFADPDGHVHELFVNK